MSKKISIAFVLLLILAVGFWQLPGICATLGVKLPQSLAFLNDIQLSSPKPKAGSPETTTPAPDAASTSNGTSVEPSKAPSDSSPPPTFAAGAKIDAPQEVVANKQPTLPGDIEFNSTTKNGPDSRLSDPANRTAFQAPVAPALQQLQAPTPQQVDGSRIDKCLVRPMDIYGEAKVPAQEQGVILEITKTVGMMVNKDEKIGRMDDSQPVVALKAVEAEIKAKDLQAKSQERYNFSVYATQVQKAKLDKLVEANLNAKNSVSLIEIEEARLMVEKTKVEAKLAIEENQVAAFAVETKKAEAETQELAIKRRQLISPISGVIKEVVPHIGEWIKGGDVVFHVIYMDRLQVEAYYNLLNDQKIGRPELMNRAVEFEFEYKKGEIRRVPAKIVYVDPSNEFSSSLVKIKAVIDNPFDKATNDWLVHPNNTGDLILFPRSQQ